MLKNLRLCLNLSFLHLKPDFRYSSWSFVSWSGLEPRINLQLTGKISLEFDSNSSLLLEYGRNVREMPARVSWKLGLMRSLVGSGLKKQHSHFAGLTGSRHFTDPEYFEMVEGNLDGVSSFQAAFNGSGEEDQMHRRKTLGNASPQHFRQGGDTNAFVPSTFAWHKVNLVTSSSVLLFFFTTWSQW